MTREEAVKYLENVVERNKTFNNVEYQTLVVLAISTLNQLGELK